MRKAQGSLEWLLIIGGAVLVALFVLYLITNTSSNVAFEVSFNAANAFCNSLSNDLIQCISANFVVNNTAFGCLFEPTPSTSSGYTCYSSRNVAYLTQCGTPAGGWISGTEYRLLNDVNTSGICYEVDAPNVSITCLDHEIKSTTDSAVVISVDNVFLKGIILGDDTRECKIVSDNPAKPPLVIDVLADNTFLLSVNVCDSQLKRIEINSSTEQSGLSQLVTCTECYHGGGATASSICSGVLPNGTCDFSC